MLIFAFIPASFFILGLFVATGGDTDGDTGPLRRVRWWLDRWGLRWIGKGAYAYPEGKTWYYPVLYCPVCMSSLWGSLFYAGAWALTGAGAWWLLWTPVHVLATYALVNFIWTRWNA